MRWWYFFLVITVPFTARAQEGTEKEQNEDLNFAGIPILSYNSPYGFLLGVNGMAFFELNKKDTISPPSQAGIGVGFSQNRSLFISAFAQLHFSEDKWRTTFAIGAGDINFQYFETSNDADGGDFNDYNSVSAFLFLKGLRKIHGRLYGGTLLKLQRSKTKFEAAVDSTEEVTMNGIGLTTLYDSRNSIYSPSRGIHSGLSFLVNPKWMGTDSVFNSIRAYINWYIPVNKKSVLACRIIVYSGIGNVPFSGQRAVGGKDIRGYTNGRYRGNQQYTTQAEYRWNFYKRWGAVGFFGMAFTQKPYSGFLPGGGAGVRFKAIPTKNINIGLDYAFGKKDQGIYFRINEAF